jgi:elongator complex protein 4
MFRFCPVFCCHLTINIRNSETFCHNFELSSRVPKELIDDAVKSGQLQYLDLEGRKLSIAAIFDEMTRAIEVDSSLPLRVCIPSLGSPIWGDVTVQVILYISQEIISTKRSRAYCTSCIVLSPLCVNTHMLVLL